MVDVDPFALFLKLIVYTSMLLVAVAGGGYLNKHIGARGEFWSSFLFLTAAMSFAVSANNLLLLFVAIEFLSITSYILVGFVREDLRSSEAGLKYFLYGSVASAVMLYGMSLLYGATGSSDPGGDRHRSLAENPSLAAVVVPSAVLIMVGLGFKASLAPFFQWTPDTYEGAPTPVTAYLSTASKAVGFAVIARVMLIGVCAGMRRLGAHAGRAGRALHVRRQPDGVAPDQCQAHAGLQFDRAGRLHAAGVGGRRRCQRQRRDGHCR